MSAGVEERAFAKLNLILNVGRRRVDGLHPLGSVFASIELHDDVRVQEAEVDGVDCAGIDGPNLATAAVAALRRRVPELPPLRVQIDKRIPVAAGLGGGSADAAAVLRAPTGSPATRSTSPPCESWAPSWGRTCPARSTRATPS